MIRTGTPGVAVALDAPSREAALTIVDRLGDVPDLYKVGLELFTRTGPDVVRELVDRGHRVFLDLKFHDIPNTVAGAVRSAVDLGVDLMTVHAAGGTAMIEAAVAAAGGRARVVGVTVLTSMEASALGAAWGRDVVDPAVEAVRLARLSRAAGLDGIVSAVWEAADVRAATDERFTIVTPGIRFGGGPAHDQSRVATPAEAARAGSSLLVVGRAITADHDPAAALRRVREEVAAEVARQGRALP